MDISTQQILVVDDEEELRKAIVEILTLDGFEVDQAASAEEAAEKLSHTAYDVLITDHNLPQKTGVELLELIKLDDAIKDLAAEDESAARLIEMRYFGGMTAEETAMVVGRSVHVVQHDLRFARAWLGRRLTAR